MKKQSFLQGSLLLAGSALAAKLCGALFKLPLTAMLGGTGMGHFSTAYGLFLPLYAVLVTGLSTAVARPVAAYTAQGDTAAARRVRSTARWLFLLAGTVGSAAAVLLARPFALASTGGVAAYPAVLAIAPAVLLCCLAAVERGYWEGRCTMVPTAVSQLAEAVVKLVCGLWLAGRFLRTPPPFLAGCSPEAAGACGAVIGVTAGAGAGLVCVYLRSLLAAREPVSGTVPGRRETVRVLLAVMVPAALGALVADMMSLIDLMLAMRSFGTSLRENAAAFRASAHVPSSIADGDAAAFVYGSFIGLAVTVFDLVPSLTNTMARSVLPCAAQRWAAGDRDGTAACAGQALVLTGLLAFPAGCGLTALARPALAFLFAGRPDEVAAAAGSLRLLVPGMVCLCLVMPVFSLLQAVGRERMPVLLMLPGLAVKLAGDLVLLPRMHAEGAALATSLSYAAILVPALVVLRRTIGPLPGVGRLLAAMLWAGAMCGAAAYLVCGRVPLPPRGAFVLAVAAGAAVYAALLALAAGRPLLARFRPPRRPCASGKCGKCQLC